VRLIFLGTRGNTRASSRRHRRHSALLIRDAGGGPVIIDYGADWLGRLGRLRPAAIVLTHGHPDHAFGLRQGAPCPVYATAGTWAALASFPIAERRLVEPRATFGTQGLTLEAFIVDHSLRAPAVGYRVAARVSFFYVPDVVTIHDCDDALASLALFIGDGATITRPLVRRHGEALFGHTTIRAQLGWCQAEGVPRAAPGSSPPTAGGSEPGCGRWAASTTSWRNSPTTASRSSCRKSRALAPP
jgi:phosphoribosyl 1,2-cyclic phosphodiesterase